MNNKIFFCLIKDRKGLNSLIVVSIAMYLMDCSIDLTDLSFRQKFCDLGISSRKLSKIIGRIEKIKKTKFSVKEKLLIENTLDLITMVYCH